jgi:hypothetical protein
VALVEPGMRVASGELARSNPIPGNHGHAVTQHSVLMVTGGHDALAEPSSVPGPAVYEAGTAPHRAQDGPGNLSVAPTVNGLFGLDAPRGGYDGEALTQPFAGSAGDWCVAAAGPGPNGGGGDGGVAPADDSAAPGRPVLPATGGGKAALGAVLFGAALLLGIAVRGRRP